MFRRIFLVVFVSSASFSALPAFAQDDDSKLKKTPREVSFETSDDGRIFASLSGTGEHAVVLAHGARFNKESWVDQATKLTAEGFTVLAIDFRGYGKSVAGNQKRARHLDVLAAIRYLHDHGSKKVSVIGGSMGGGAAARAAVETKKGEIDRLILLAHVPIKNPEKLMGKILFVVSKGDRLKDRVAAQHESAPDPKRLVILEGNAHAQNIFKTEHGDELMKLIIEWLND